MKKVICIIFTLTTLQNCSAAGSPQQIVKAYMAAWNQHHAHQAASYFAPQGVYYDASVGKPVTGRSAAEQQVIAPFMQGVPDLKWQMTGQPVENNSAIAFEWVFSGHNTGNWSGSPATGKEVRFTGVSFIRLKQGKIIWQGDYYDSATLSRELK
ncbi:MULTISPECIES: ester cyclase [Tatumella]|uniref:Ester cyclase n=1 Tax=Tatumella punctata TaxID=399969 RepID=A0ABW1VRP7_9GAMM|nr:MULTISPECIES: ester cyclase [unclassified Tatumella]MBS0856304.1 ester cyclase [Tatumella sp. JGM16]MBS0894328.1 ester cyclase [Tatumella sp. JGM130]MBS0913387.1 ester cyclase [Tatumella sp. JGM91]